MSSSSACSSSASRKINGVSRDEIFQLFREAKSKDDVIHVLNKHQNIIKRIPLPCPSVTIEQAKKDFRRERVLLNDVPYIPDQLDVSRSNGFAKSLSMLIDRIKNRGHLNCTEEENVADLIMRRACRTSAGADSFFTVQRLLCVEGTFVTQKTSGHDPPIRIDVFISSNCEDLFHQAEGSSRWIYGLGLANTNGSGSIRPYSEVILRSDSHMSIISEGYNSGGVIGGSGSNPSSNYNNSSNSVNVRPFSVSSSSEAPSPVLSASGSSIAAAAAARGTTVAVPLESNSTASDNHNSGDNSSNTTEIADAVAIALSGLSTATDAKDHQHLPNDTLQVTATAAATEVTASYSTLSFDSTQQQPLHTVSKGPVLGALSMDTGENVFVANGVVNRRHSNSEAPHIPHQQQLLQQQPSSASKLGQVSHRNTILSWDSKTKQQLLQQKLANATMPPNGNVAAGAFPSVASAHSSNLFDMSSISRELCCRVEMRNSFAIYDVDAMDILSGDPTLDPPAWIDLEVVLIDESNFKTGENFRRLELNIINPKLKQKVSKSSALRNPFSPMGSNSHSSSINGNVNGNGNNSSSSHHGSNSGREREREHGYSASTFLFSSVSTSPSTPPRGGTSAANAVSSTDSNGALPHQS